MKNLIILFCFLPFRLFAQDLTGVWTGTLYNDSTQSATKYEIAVSEKNGKLSAYSYAIFHIEDKEVYGVKSLEVIQSKGKTFFRDRDLLVDNYPADAPKGVKQISSIKVFDSLGAQYMTGTFTTTRSGKYGRPVTGTIVLVKEKNNLRDIALIKHIIKQGLAPALDFITAENTDKKTKTVPQNDLAKNENAGKVKVDSTGLIGKEDAVAAKNSSVAQQKKEIKADASVPIKKNTTTEETTARNNSSAELKINGEKEVGAAAVKDVTATEQKDQSKGSPIQQPKVGETKDLTAEKNVVKKEPFEEPKKSEQKTAFLNNDSSSTKKANPVTDVIEKEQKDQTKGSTVQQPKIAEPKELTAEKNVVKKEPLDVSEKAEQKTAFVKNDSSATEKANSVTAKIDATIITAKKEEKVSDIKTVQKKPEQKATNIPAIKLPTVTEQLASREILNIQTVEFTSDSLRLELYDNGTIDGDSVSVIVNGRVVMEHQRLSGKAIPKTVYADGDSLKVVMFAENLGSIAPNTGLLIVYDGKKRYEITFSGDLKKNSAILFKRKRN